MSTIGKIIQHHYKIWHWETVYSYKTSQNWSCGHLLRAMVNNSKSFLIQMHL